MIAKSQEESIANEIKKIYHTPDSNPETLIEEYLEKELGGRSQDDRLSTLEKVTNQFELQSHGEGLAIAEQVLTRLGGLFLRGNETELPPDELAHKLAESLNSFFDKLNTIISAIQTELFGHVSDLTVMVGSKSNPGNEEVDDNTPEEYIEQIKDAFDISHRAFHLTIKSKISQVLNDIDPDRISRSIKAGFLFGHFRKAALWNHYYGKFQIINQWYDHGRFKRDIKEGFERNCRKLLKEKEREEQ